MTGALRFTIVAAALFGAGCGNRILIYPSATEGKELDYIYFVDEIEGRDSKITRCKILADNRVDCRVEFDLD